MTEKELIGQLEKFRIVPVLTLPDAETGLRVCECLCDNHLPVAEITFRTAAAPEIIAAARRRFPRMLIGAGTVLTAGDVLRARDAGADFGVAPGFNPAVVRAAAERKLPFIPGVCTPSELELAAAEGCRLLKFYPACAAGGVPMLKALLAPYLHLGIRIMPTGGITPENMGDFLAVPAVAAVGGTWLGRRPDDRDAIAAAVRDALGRLQA